MKIDILKKLRDYLTRDIDIYAEREEYMKEPVNKISEVYGYDGFIAPDGNFYRVRKIGTNEYSHAAWAYHYLKDNYDIRVNNPTYYIMHKLHFIIVNYYPGLEGVLFTPKKNEEYITDEQRKMIDLLSGLYNKEGEKDEKNFYKRTR